MNNFKIERAPSYYDQVYNSIKEMIFNGVFKPGDRIYETKIASEFQVSRSPVREAIRSLEKEGLLSIDTKSRITVYEPTIMDIEDIYECRQALESLAARLATRNASDEELVMMENILIKTKENIDQAYDKPTKTVITLNSEFHNLILNCSRNKRLEKQINDLQSLTYFYRFIDIYEKKRSMDIFTYHLQIFNFIKQRDEEKASQAMKNHIANDLKHLKNVLKMEFKNKTE